MTCRLYFGVGLPGRVYNLCHLDIDDTGKTILDLKEDIATKIELPIEEIELLFQGDTLKDDEKIGSVAPPNSLIQVLQKPPQYQPYVSKKNYTKEDCQRIAQSFNTVVNLGITVGARINILSSILNEYPEFRRNLAAQALVRDSILFHSFNQAEVIEKIAENYPLICDAEEFILKITKKEVAKKTHPPLIHDETLSETTSSSEEENANASSNANQSEHARIRRISRHQLAAALLAIGTSSSNSLSNIAQRNSNLAAAAAAQQQEPESSVQNNHQSSSTVSPQQVPSTNRISSALFNNALTQALMLGAAGLAASSSAQEQQQHEYEEMDTTETNELAVNDSDLPEIYRNHPFAQQLRSMREMGLIDDDVNFNVLQITNGNLENAINLVLASNDIGNSSNNTTNPN